MTDVVTIQGSKYKLVREGKYAWVIRKKRTRKDQVEYEFFGHYPRADQAIVALFELRLREIPDGTIGMDKLESGITQVESEINVELQKLIGKPAKPRVDRPPVRRGQNASSKGGQTLGEGRSNEEVSNESN